MGGNALSEKAKRMNNERYNIIKSEILQLLQPFYLKCIVPFEKPGKTDHGDLDVLCLIDDQRYPSGCDAITHLGSKESTRNGNIVSFEYKSHQIDLIHVKTIDELNFSRFFYSYGDVGMITGMILHTVSMYLSSSKLMLHVEEYQKNMLLTTNIQDVFNFCGWSDFDIWVSMSQKNMTSEEKVFEWIAQNKFFRYSMFKRNELKCVKRKRDTDRPMFAHFVDYCNARLHLDKPDKITVIDVQKAALLYFDKQQEYDTIAATYHMKKAISEKFNGKLIMQWYPDVSGKILGDLIARIKTSYPDEKLIQMDVDEIKSIVCAFHKNDSMCINKQQLHTV